MQSLLHYRVIFLYQKVFHTFMCSIDCTTVRYHTIETDNQLLLSSLLLRGKGLNLLPNCRMVAFVCVDGFFFLYFTTCVSALFLIRGTVHFVVTLN